MVYYLISFLSVIIIPFIAGATPPPQVCVGEAPAGYEVAYPMFSLGYLSWSLVLLGFYLSFSSHQKAKQELQKRQVTFSRIALTLPTVMGIFLTICVTSLSLMMFFTGFFRNDCHFCIVNRPKITFISELWIVIPTLSVSLLLKRLFQWIPLPMVRHYSHLLLIIITWFMWLLSTLFNNAWYLKTYCG